MFASTLSTMVDVLCNVLGVYTVSLLMADDTTAPQLLLCILHTLRTLQESFVLPPSLVLRHAKLLS